jgi:phosphoserine phosphatase RsbU/P
MKILIAEDDNISRMTLVQMLKKLGHDVTEKKNGKEAWESYLVEAPNILITDWMMPEMDGLSLCRAVRKEHRNRYTYIIMLTALGGKESFLEGMGAGADDFVTKPCDLDTLAARLRVAERILNLQSEVRQLEGLLPICAYCKKIRDDGQNWQSVESFVASRTDAEFSHGICPDCVEKHWKQELMSMRSQNPKS